MMNKSILTIGLLTLALQAQAAVPSDTVNEQFNQQVMTVAYQNGDGVNPPE